MNLIGEYRSWWRIRAGLSLALGVAVLGAMAPAALGATPNDTSFPKQWGNSNVGQFIPLQEPPGEALKESVAGTPRADDRATEAWSVTTGSRSIVLGELDTGADYTHPDLQANIWNNPEGKGGCPAGTTHGYNVLGLLLTEACDPMDTETGGYGGHGTHVAGIVGAVGNNNIGIAGMNWQTTILPVRWLQSAGAGEATKLIAGMKWLVKVKQEGVNVRVVNDSPNFESDQPGLKAAIEELGANNILFVTAAGNSKKAFYPCVYDLPNEICVTASNNRDELPPWANEGVGVDIAAPGASIYSTLLGGGYGYLSGGSMAAAQVSGAAALILSVAPNLTAEQLRADILSNVHPVPSLAGKVETGGRLDVCKALPGCEPAPPPPTPSPPPPPPPPPAVQPSSVALTSTVLKVKHNKIKIGLRCSGSTACASRLALTIRKKTRSGHGTRTRFKTTVLTIGTASFAVGAEGTVQVTIKLNATGRWIVRTGTGRLYANLTIYASVPAPPSTRTQRVRLVWPHKSGR